MKEFKVSDEQKSEYYAKHYEQIQKQWKEYTDNFMISLSNRVCINVRLDQNLSKTLLIFFLQSECFKRCCQQFA